MALKLDNALLEELGLGTLPESEKQLLLRQIYERLEMNVGMRLADQMTNEQLDAFEKFVDANDDKGAFQWLETNFPNYKQVVNEEFEKLKTEIRLVASQILAAAAANQPAAAGPPPGYQAAPAMAPQPGMAGPGFAGYAMGNSAAAPGLPMAGQAVAPGAAQYQAYGGTPAAYPPGQPSMGMPGGMPAPGAAMAAGGAMPAAGHLQPQYSGVPGGAPGSAQPLTQPAPFPAPGLPPTAGMPGNVPPPFQANGQSAADQPPAGPGMR